MVKMVKDNKIFIAKGDDNSKLMSKFNRTIKGGKFTLARVFNEQTNPDWEKNAQSNSAYFENKGLKTIVLNKGENHPFYVEKGKKFKS